MSNVTLKNSHAANYIIVCESKIKEQQLCDDGCLKRSENIAITM